MKRYLILPAAWLIGGGAWAGTGAEPVRTQPASLTGGDMLQWLIGLVVVLGAIIACAWLLRKLAHLPAGGAAGLRVIGGISLGAREKVLVLQAGRKQLVLGVTPGHIGTLCVLDEDAAVASPVPERPALASFAARLGQAMRGRSNA